ncbi:MAG: response regulator transcription factor [Myxococcales bacterium]|nr:response regulator transcription factor [Myxococcales bacterium]
MVERANILITDDDGHIREVVRFALEGAGYDVTEAATGAQALEFMTHQPFDLVVLDIVMPGMDGLEVCQNIRKSYDTPIIFLSSKDEELDTILGLELGADDYMAKPFSPRELVTRIKVVLRRCRGHPPEPMPEATVSYGPLRLDTARHTCTVQEALVILTVTEFALLVVLARSPGRVFTRQQLVDAAYGPGHSVSDRTIDSHIRRIRKKLELHDIDAVETVYGLGYKMREIYHISSIPPNKPSR